MNRTEFFRKVIRYMLLLLLAVIAAALGKRIVTGSDCEACAGKGICKGKSDCSTYLAV